MWEKCRDQWIQILMNPTWDGNLISKSDRDTLRDAGLIWYDKTAQDPDPCISHITGAWVPCLP